jgi:hypothetical protein
LLPAVIAGLVLFGILHVAGAVGLRQVAVPDRQGEPLQVDIWYPSDAPATPRRFGLFEPSVALPAPVVLQFEIVWSGPA